MKMYETTQSKKHFYKLKNLKVCYDNNMLTTF